MSDLDISAADAIIYETTIPTVDGYAITGYAEKDALSCSADGDFEETKSGGKTVKEAFTNPGRRLKGDFTAEGSRPLLHKGEILSVLEPGEVTPRKYVVDSFDVKRDDETGAWIVTLDMHHRYSMTAAYDAGPIDPDTGLPYAATFRISGQIIMGADGAPVEGAEVSDGTRTVETDANGFYEIVSVPAGTFTLTPSKTGLEFVPATIAGVVVSTANVVGKSFIASET